MKEINGPALTVFNCIIMAHHALIMLMLGPLIPEIMTSYGIGEGSVGLLLSAGSLGFMVGPLIAGVGIDRVGIKKVLIVGYFLELALLICFAFSPFFIIIVVINFFLIIAGGFIETSANVIPTLQKNGNPIALLNLVHFFFSVGGFVAPLLIGLYISRLASWQSVFFVVAIPTLTLGILSTQLKMKVILEKGSMENIQPISLFKLLKTPTVFFGALSLFFFMGAELGFSSWIIYYLERNLLFTKIQASLGLSLFWVGIMIGRLVNAALSRKLSSFTMVTSSSILSIVSGISLLFLSSFTGVYSFLFIIGFSMAGGYPNVLGEINRRFTGKKGMVTGILVFGAGAGAMLFQWGIGITAEYAGPTQALLIPPSLMALMALGFWMAIKDNKKRSNSNIQ